VRDGAALDRLTGLIQSRNVSPAEFPPGWREAGAGFHRADESRTALRSTQLAHAQPP